MIFNILYYYILVTNTSKNKSQGLELNNTDKNELNLSNLDDIIQIFTKEFEIFLKQFQTCIDKNLTTNRDKRQIGDILSRLIILLDKIICMCNNFKDIPENRDFFIIGIYPYFIQHFNTVHKNILLSYNSFLSIIERKKEFILSKSSKKSNYKLIEDFFNFEIFTSEILSDENNENCKRLNDLIPNSTQYSHLYTNKTNIANEDVFNPEEINVMNENFTDYIQKNKTMFTDLQKKVEKNLTIIKQNIDPFKISYNLNQKISDITLIYNNIIHDHKNFIVQIKKLLDDISILDKIKEISFSNVKVKISRYQIFREKYKTNKSLLDKYRRLLNRICNNTNNITNTSYIFLQDDKNEIEDYHNKIIYSLAVFKEFITIINFFSGNNGEFILKNKKLRNDRKMNKRILNNFCKTESNENKAIEEPHFNTELEIDENSNEDQFIPDKTREESNDSYEKDHGYSTDGENKNYPTDLNLKNNNKKIDSDKESVTLTSDDNSEDSINTVKDSYHTTDASDGEDSVKSYTFIDNQNLEDDKKHENTNIESENTEIEPENNLTQFQEKMENVQKPKSNIVKYILIGFGVLILILTIGAVSYYFYYQSINQ